MTDSLSDTHTHTHTILAIFTATGCHATSDAQSHLFDCVSFLPPCLSLSVCLLSSSHTNLCRYFSLAVLLECSDCSLLMHVRAPFFHLQHLIYRPVVPLIPCRAISSAPQIALSKPLLRLIKRKVIAIVRHRYTAPLPPTPPAQN